MLENICALFSFQRTFLFLQLSRADFKHYILCFLFCQQLFQTFLFCLFCRFQNSLFCLLLISNVDYYISYT